MKQITVIVGAAVVSVVLGAKSPACGLHESEQAKDPQLEPQQPRPEGAPAMRPGPAVKLSRPGGDLAAAAQQPAQPQPERPRIDWRSAEQGILANQVQLTFADRFVRAGESYFSPDGAKIIFQAIETPPVGAEPLTFYAMFVADVVRDPFGKIESIADIRRISPPGSANTCGWFHPTQRDVVIFASTLTTPTESKPPGWQRATGQYRWMFPPEMRIVTCALDKADGTAAGLEPLLGDGQAYVAECSLSPNGRHLLYCSLESNEGDIFVKDLVTGGVTRLVSATGYDGGPFFSPDGKRICYRSDRAGNNLLQIYIGELAFNDAGTIVGLKREFQITDDQDVNWAPYWHPAGRHLLYTSSRMGHDNYEVYLIDADDGAQAGSSGVTKYGTRMRRVTVADGADVLPVFDSAGKTMMWTSKRDAGATSQIWAADFVMELDPKPQATPAFDPAIHKKKP